MIQSVQLEEDRLGLEQEVTATVASVGARIYEVGISYTGRTYAEGKKIGWRDGVRALVCTVKYAPLSWPTCGVVGDGWIDESWQRAPRSRGPTFCCNVRVSDWSEDHANRMMPHWLSSPTVTAVAGASSRTGAGGGECGVWGHGRTGFALPTGDGGRVGAQPFWDYRSSSRRRRPPIRVRHPRMVSSRRTVFPVPRRRSGTSAAPAIRRSRASQRRSASNRATRSTSRSRLTRRPITSTSTEWATTAATARGWSRARPADRDAPAEPAGRASTTRPPVSSTAATGACPRRGTVPSTAVSGIYFAN